MRAPTIETANGELTTNSEQTANGGQTTNSELTSLARAGGPIAADRPEGVSDR